MKNRNKAKMRKQVARKGYFEVGDCIEVSGRYSGIVVIANAEKFGICRLTQAHNGQCFICPDISMYSNESKYYQSKYWIKKVSAPSEYKEMLVKPLEI